LKGEDVPEGVGVGYQRAKQEQTSLAGVAQNIDKDLAHGLKSGLNRFYAQNQEGKNELDHQSFGHEQPRNALPVVAKKSQYADEHNKGAKGA
jgi:hypothetical protein